MKNSSVSPVFYAVKHGIFRKADVRNKAGKKCQILGKIPKK